MYSNTDNTTQSHMQIQLRALQINLLFPIHHQHFLTACSHVSVIASQHEAMFALFLQCKR